MSLGRTLRETGARVLWPLSAGIARARQVSPRPTRFAGAWPSREAALASLPPAAQAGYDDPAIAEVSFAVMAGIAPADWPVMFWLRDLLGPGAEVLDVGGHLGTKHIAFAGHLPLDAWHWTVQDLPGIVAAALRAQAAGRVPAAIRFVTSGAGLAPDLLLASGLMQYLDRPLADLLGELARPPRHVLLNKVAVREGPEVVTLERIGPARVAYRIRNRAGFEAEIAALGYRIRDGWSVPGIAHVIPTHPWLGASASRGYLLERG